MAVFTLDQLRQQVRERTGLEAATNPTDTELNTIINASGAELWGILVSKFSDIGLAKTSFNIVAGQADYAFASLSSPVTNFFKLRGLDLFLGGNRWEPMQKFELEERRNYDRWPALQAGWPRYAYRLQGDGFELLPSPTANSTARLWYITTFPTMASGSATLSGVNGWEEYVVVDACIKARAKQDLPADQFVQQKSFLLDRIHKESENLDANKPMRVKQVRDEDVDGWW